MLQLLRFAFRVSLYLLTGLPWSRCPPSAVRAAASSGRDPIVLHSDDVSRPSQLALDDQALNTEKAALLQDLEVGHSVLPLDVAADKMYFNRLNTL